MSSGSVGARSRERQSKQPTARDLQGGLWFGWCRTGLAQTERCAGPRGDGTDDMTAMIDPGTFEHDLARRPAWINPAECG